MEIDVTVENNRVVDAKTEQMLVGRSPFDSVYFTSGYAGFAQQHIRLFMNSGSEKYSLNDMEKPICLLEYKYRRYDSCKYC